MNKNPQKAWEEVLKELGHGIFKELAPEILDLKQRFNTLKTERDTAINENLQLKVRVIELETKLKETQDKLTEYYLNELARLGQEMGLY